MNKKFQKILEVGVLLSAEKDYEKLLRLILDTAMDLTKADGGTLYLLNNNALEFKLMVTKSFNIYKGGKDDPIDLPPVKLSKKNVSSAAVLANTVINIKDVYNCKNFDFTGTKKYDDITGYKTKSVLVVPMENDKGKIIGVLQFINAISTKGNVVCFKNEDVNIVKSLASLAAVALTNMNYANQVTDLLYGFVKVMSNAIDARTPYNLNHTRNIVKYAESFLDYENNNNLKFAVSEELKNEILLSAWLHDIGKLITPLSVMDKSDRLGENKDKVISRFAIISLLNENEYLKNKISKDEYENTSNYLKDSLAFILEINNAGFLPEDKLNKVKEIASHTYLDIDGNKNNYLTLEELTQLCVVKGTLTSDERKIMENHVVMTSKMLEGLTFPDEFKDVRFIASSHHEYLNGTGYPNHLKASDLPFSVRLLTILDIFEALTAKDRPYKKAMPLEKVWFILNDMVKEGKLDADILNEFIASKVYE